MSDELLASYVLQLERRIEAVEIVLARWHQFTERLEGLMAEVDRAEALWSAALPDGMK